MSKRIRNAHLAKLKNVFLNQLSLVVDRLNNHHTQKEIAQVCGVSSTVISLIKNDRKDKVSLEALTAVAEALGIDFEYGVRSINGKVQVRVHIESALEYQTRIKGVGHHAHHRLRLV